MTRLLVITLLIVLPLRGWTAGHVVIHMAGGVPLTQSVAATMPADCPMLMALSTDPPVAKSLACKSCQLCMAWAAVALIPQASAPVARQAEPITQACAFASADVVQDGKPPIS